MSRETITPTEKLFGSKTRAKLLQLFFESPNKSFYVREMTRVIDEQIYSVRRELINLETIGIIKRETFDNKIYYSANNKHPFAHPLTEIFSKKTYHASKKSDVEASVWDEYTRPVRSFLKGLIVTNRLPGQDGLDLLIVGNDKTKKLTHWAEMIEKKMGKPINYAILSPDDYEYRRSVHDRFIDEVFEMEISEVFDPDKIIKG